MNRKFIIGICICIAATKVSGQGKIDTVAVSLLDHMSAVISELNSCSVLVKSNYDVRNQTFGLVKHSDEQQVYLHAPDRLLVKSSGDKGARDFYYDGKMLSYYSSDQNQFAKVQAPPTIMEMIDSVHKTYGIEFPVADFFYPAFVDDIIAESTSLAYLGMAEVNGKECFHIAGAASDKTFQFWISNDAFYLPVKVVIVYTNREMNPQYEAVLSDWKINPDLPNALFEFTAPPRAKKIIMVSFPVKNILPGKK
jgi:hypothetical protein